MPTGLHLDRGRTAFSARLFALRIRKETLLTSPHKKVHAQGDLVRQIYQRKSLKHETFGACTSSITSKEGEKQRIGCT